MINDISNDTYLARMAIVEACALIAAPHSRLPVRVFKDGDAWCCLYGENLQEGIAGFGRTPHDACAEFDMAWSRP